MSLDMDRLPDRAELVDLVRSFEGTPTRQQTAPILPTPEARFVEVRDEHGFPIDTVTIKSPASPLPYNQFGLPDADYAPERKETPDYALTPTDYARGGVF